MRAAPFLLIALTACGPGGHGWPAAAVDAASGGDRLMAAGDYEGARRAYLRAAGAEGLDADILSGLGAAALNLGRLGQAETLLRAAVTRDPGSVAALNNLGVVLMERGAAPEAARLFRAAQEIDGGRSAEIRANLELALSKRDGARYSHTQNENFTLIRRGEGDWRLLSTIR